MNSPFNPMLENTPMSNVNLNTRPRYDSLSTQNRHIITQQPLKYITEPTSQYRTYVEPLPENINTSNVLRMKPTRLNYYNRPEGELYGTAPNKSLGHRTLVDVESSLFFNNDVNNKCDRTITEQQFDTLDYINHPLAVDTNLRPIDTQADLRNSYALNLNN